MENDAKGFSALAFGLLLFQQMARAGCVGDYQSGFGGKGSGEKLKKKAPTAAIIDSQSVKMAGQPGKRGFDAGKKIMGRKRHILVDTLGLLLGVVVHPANIQDRDGAKQLKPFLLLFGWLQVLFVDGAYAGKLAHWIRQLPRHRNLRLEVVKRPKEAKGFHLLPRRWVVERTFAWFGHFRRLSKDYESKTEHSEAFLYIASASIMARRLSKAHKN